MCLSRVATAARPASAATPRLRTPHSVVNPTIARGNQVGLVRPASLGQRPGRPDRRADRAQSADSPGLRDQDPRGGEPPDSSGSSGSRQIRPTRPGRARQAPCRPRTSPRSWSSAPVHLGPPSSLVKGLVRTCSRLPPARSHAFILMCAASTLNLLLDTVASEGISVGSHERIAPP